MIDSLAHIKTYGIENLDRGTTTGLGNVSLKNLAKDNAVRITMAEDLAAREWDPTFVQDSVNEVRALCQILVARGANPMGNTSASPQCTPAPGADAYTPALDRLTQLWDSLQLRHTDTPLSPEAIKGIEQQCLDELMTMVSILRRRSEAATLVKTEASAT